MRQILYVSTSTVPGDRADLVGILEQSRHNNAIDGITGLLWSDGLRFMQVFEGPHASIALTFARIAADPRHHSLEILSDTRITQHQFSGWEMAHRHHGDPVGMHAARLRRRLAQASPDICAHFLSLIASAQPA